MLADFVPIDRSRVEFHPTEGFDVGGIGERYRQPGRSIDRSRSRT
jgi:hypothetical protein